MNKVLWAVVFFLCCSLPVLSQKKSSGNLVISIGSCLPAGNFGNTDFYDHSSGFANLGEAVSVCYAQPVAEKWNLLFTVSGQRNPVNKKAFESALSSMPLPGGVYFTSGSGNQAPVAPDTTVFRNWKFDKTSWLFAGLQAGMQRVFMVDHRSCVTVNASAGIVYASSPHLKGASVTDTASAYLEQTKKTATGFAFTAGAGYHYSLTQKLFLAAALSFTGTGNLTFKNIQTTMTTSKGTYPANSIYQSMIIANGRQAINTINLSVGVGVRLK
ncbi:MAG: hypothetical protein JSU05_14070 [Bacteroidetes bacterium]|nr:hypothetical protein [Bacteroidota bacterium]